MDREAITARRRSSIILQHHGAGQGRARSRDALHGRRARCGGYPRQRAVPGPIATRAASGIDHFDALIDDARARSAGGRLVTIEEVGAAARFLASDGAAGMTGNVVYVDAGRHIRM